MSFDEFNDFVRKNLKWNLTFNILDGSSFLLGMVLVAFDTVLPVFIRRLGGSNFLVGLLPAIFILSTNILPLAIANYTERIERRKKLVLALGTFMRAPWMVLAVLCALFGSQYPSLLIGMTVVCFVLFSIGAGLVYTPWLDMVLTMIPVNVRGRMASGRTIGGFGMGILGGLAVTHILKSVPFPYSYSILFGLGFVFMMLAVLFIGLLREPVYPKRTEHKTLKQYFSALPSIIKGNGNFLYFIVVRMLLTIGIAIGGFYSVFAVEHYNLDESYAGVFTTIGVVTAMGASYFLGLLGDRFGHKINCVIGCISIVAACALSIWPPPLFLYYTVFVLRPITHCVMIISAMNIVVEFCKPQEQPTYIALSQALSAPAALLMLGAGFLADTMGFTWLFSCVGILALAGTLVAAFAFKDPRVDSRNARHNA
ncbi:MAG: MFS transporter [Chitinivibrionales bacterium]|nr:MFS transporter [Chitinivibrionales bacterium]